MMTREEVKHVLEYIVSSGAMFRTPSMKDTTDVWYDMLQEYNCKDVQEATRVTLATNNTGFAPSVGQIIANIHVADNYTNLNDMQAWALVSRALRRSTYYAKEEFEKLPDLVQQAVGSPENLQNWAVMDGDSVENVLQSNFQRSYRTVLERQKNYKRMPVATRNLIESVLPPKLTTKTEEPIKLTDGAEKHAETGNTMPQWVIDKLKEMKGE